MAAGNIDTPYVVSLDAYRMYASCAERMEQSGSPAHRMAAAVGQDGASWGSGLETLGGSFSQTIGVHAFPPQPVSWGPNRIDLFVLDGNDKVYHKWTDGNGWGPSQTGWEDLGRPPL